MYPDSNSGVDFCVKEVITKEEAIRRQKEVAALYNHEYDSDRRALEDFMINHWARWCDEPVGIYKENFLQLKD